MKTEWELTILVYDVDDKLVADLSQKAWFYTEREATLAAEKIARNAMKLDRADYWLVGVN